jgi:hypothetical protein
MAFGILSIVIFLAVLYFAIIGVQATVVKYRQEHALEIVRDLLKYLILFIAVLLTCLGLAGLLGLALDAENIDYNGKLDAAQRLAFLVVGIPVIAVLARWIRRDFRANNDDRNSPAWQIYLFAASTSSLLLWFLPLVNALKWFSGQEYQPRQLAEAIVAFVVWLIHMKLLEVHTSIISNAHRFAGLATGLISAAVGSINAIAFGISKWMDVVTGKYEIQNALILLVVAVPVALFYWGSLNNNGSEVEIRIYRTFGGKAIPTIFLTLAATFALGSSLNWFFGEHINDAPRYFTHVPQQIATVLVLAPMIYFFRYLVSEYPRDDISRLFQYLISGGALIGVGIAGGWFIAGLFEFNSFINTSIAGFAGLLVTLPIWRFEWRHCQEAIHQHFEIESNSPIRRIYLYVMMAVPTIAGFISAVILSYQLFKGILVGGFNWIDIKEAAGALVSAGLIAIYQYRVYRSERQSIASGSMRLAVRD